MQRALSVSFVVFRDVGTRSTVGKCMTVATADPGV